MKYMRRLFTLMVGFALLSALTGFAGIKEDAGPPGTVISKCSIDNVVYDHTTDYFIMEAAPVVTEETVSADVTHLEAEKATWSFTYKSAKEAPERSCAPFNIDLRYKASNIYQPPSSIKKE